MCPHPGGMRKSTHTPHYDLFRRRLVAMRNEAGLNQRELAKRLKVHHSFVSKVEVGERRVDIVEFFWICEALGVPAEKAASSLILEFRKLRA